MPTSCCRERRIGASATIAVQPQIAVPAASRRCRPVADAEETPEGHRREQGDRDAGDDDRAARRG